MFHHDKRDYDVACAETKAWFTDKLQQQIEAGRHHAMGCLASIDSLQPKDTIRIGKDLADQIHVVPQPDGPSVVVLGKDAAKAARVHEHARQQLAQRVGVPGRWIGDMCASGEGWQAALAQHTLREFYERSMDRMLLRAVPVGKHADATTQYEVRGVLSDKYRRLDSRVLFAAFAVAAHEAGLVPINGIHSDVKASVRMVLPQVFEPVKNQVCAYGMELRNSDYGAGGVTVSCFVHLPWCTNQATLNNELRKVHLGSKLPTDLRLTQQTYNLDAEAMASAIGDVTREALSPNRLLELNAATAKAAEKEITWADAKRLVAGKLNKSETIKAEVLFEDTDDQAESGAHGPGSRFKLSNVLSWMANSDKVTGDRKLELQRLAGELIHN